jgi:hypothetical protein
MGVRTTLVIGISLISIIFVSSDIFCAYAKNLDIVILCTSSGSNCVSKLLENLNLVLLFLIYSESLYCIEASISIVAIPIGIFALPLRSN